MRHWISTCAVIVAVSAIPSLTSAATFGFAQATVSFTTTATISDNVSVTVVDVSNDPPFEFGNSSTDLSDDEGTPRKIDISSSSQADDVTTTSFANAEVGYSTLFVSDGTGPETLSFAIDYDLAAMVSQTGPAVPADFSTEDVFGGALAQIELEIRAGVFNSVTGEETSETIALLQARDLVSGPNSAPASDQGTLNFSREIASDEAFGLFFRVRADTFAVIDGVPATVVPLPTPAFLLFGSLIGLGFLRRPARQAAP